MTCRGVRTSRDASGVTIAFVETLIARAEPGEDDGGFAARVAENQRRVFQIAYSVLGNAADAEEVAQEAFLQAFRKAGSLRAAGKFRAWVSRIVFRLALNRRRGLGRRMARGDAWDTAGTPNGTDGHGRTGAAFVVVRRLRERAGGTSGAAGATGRAAAAGGARRRAAGGIWRASAGRGAGRGRMEACQAVAGMGAGRSSGGGGCRSDDWSDFAPNDSANDPGYRSRRRSKACGMASAERRAAGDSGARDSAKYAETG